MSETEGPRTFAKVGDLPLVQDSLTCGSLGHEMSNGSSASTILLRTTHSKSNTSLSAGMLRGGAMER